MTQSFLSAKSLTPGKMILIGVLGVVLAGVIISQLAGGGDATDKPVQGRKRPVSASARRKRVRSSPPTEVAQPEIPARAAWPEHTPESLLSHNPFAIPAWSAAASRKTEPNPSQLDDTQERKVLGKIPDGVVNLQQSGVSMVMIVQGEPVAMIGDLEVHVGDVIEGCIVEEITQDGVVVREKQAP